MYFIRKCFYVLGILICIENINAQNEFTAYAQPQIALNYKVSPYYYHNFSIENRNYLIEEGQSKFKIRHIHLAHFSNLKIKDNQSVALGVQYRFRKDLEGGPNELRLTQQYNLTKQGFAARFGHRLRIEQRITQAQTIHRFRYRFSIDLPLQGERLDIGESYLVGNAETLLSVGNAALPAYDQRFTLQIGWLLGEKAKLQIGTEYRFENFIENTENVLFLLTGLNFSL